MSESRYLVLKTHIRSYSDPITFEKGAELRVGEKYEGPEDWENWYWVHVHGQSAGWVPGQLFEIINGQSARALDNYTAKELTVEKGEKVRVQKILNGWAWCVAESSNEAGWVPLLNLGPSDS